ncbi:transketolase [Anaerobacterium chartisolvens]|uniref:Transketolase n=1 Tax=Anaerobacterium chartisolvens TaxID=1297424 RepID=A0A369B7M5_9FIRM|nr:transketolase C-terminal domain-containing protein [Anaerobacterium chartisolvens]RCX17523.1 transketolase [Anaerobacterium chartisolvens]
MRMQNQRQVYGQELVELGRENERIVVLEADLGKSTMSCMFQQEFPERYFEMGIAEANMVSFAAGLSLTGKIAFVNSFAVFAAGRPYDQIRQGVCIGRLNVKIIGSSAGLSDFGDGATHQAVEDIAIMRAIPNLTVIAPCDGVEAKKAIRAVAELDGPAYVRISRNDMQDIFPEEQDFEIGKPYVVKEGRDVAVFAAGVMVSMALKAAEQLEAEGISVRVVNVSTLKPFNDKAVVELSRGMKGVVTAEEHSYIGGLASAAAYALRGSSIPMEAVAINDVFGQSAHSADELMIHYGLTDKDIVNKIKSILK